MSLLKGGSRSKKAHHNSGQKISHHLRDVVGRRKDFMFVLFKRWCLYFALAAANTRALSMILPVYSPLMPGIPAWKDKGVVWSDYNEGDMAVRLGIGMTEKDPPEKSEVPPAPCSATRRRSVASTDPPGLLSLCGQSLVWMSGTRKWQERNDSLVRYRLLETAKQIQDTGRACIGDHLFIGTWPETTCRSVANSASFITGDEW